MNTTDELYEMLRKIGNSSPGTSTGDDESAPVEKPEDLYTDPPGIETVPPDAPQQHTQEVQNVHDDGRGKMVDRIMDSKPLSDSADQKLISQNFAHGASGNFTTHSLHLREKSVEKISHPRSETLAERVNKVAGRF